MSLKKWCTTICGFLLLCGANGFFFAAEAVANEDLTEKHLENVRIETRGVSSLFSRLSLAYDIPIGLEIARNDDEFTTYHLEFKQGTLSDLLTQFVSQHQQYAWEIRDGVVNVFPQETQRDSLLRELLATEIRSFSVKKRTSCWNLQESLVSTPEIKRFIEANGMVYRPGDISGFYIQQLGKDFTLDISKMKLKAILNRVIKESPVAKIWTVRRDRSDQSFSIRINARLEYSPKGRDKTVDGY